MKGLCGADCDNCRNKKICKGCEASCGRPFGGFCYAYKLIHEGGIEHFEKTKAEIMAQVNGLGIEGMPEVKELFCLNGSFVNLEYTMDNGKQVSFLNDNDVYLGCQLEKDENRCFGVAAGRAFIIVCEYGKNGSNARLIAFIRRSFLKKNI